MARPYLPFEIVSGEDGKGTTYYVSAASGHVRIPSGVVVLGQSLDVNAGDLHAGDIIHAFIKRGSNRSNNCGPRCVS